MMAVIKTPDGLRCVTWPLTCTVMYRLNNFAVIIPYKVYSEVMKPTPAATALAV